MAYLGEDIKKLGFGLMRLPRKGDDYDMPMICDMVDYYLANGFTYFDTAYVYDGGGSEKAIGEALVNVTNGQIANIKVFDAANTSITGGLTFNVSGGTIGNLFYAGGNTLISDLSIAGGVRLNVTGGLMTGRVSSGVNGTSTTTVTVTGGMYLSFTGGTLVKDIYGSGDGFGSVTGGVHILIDGLESKVKCYGA